MFLTQQLHLLKQRKLIDDELEQVTCSVQRYIRENWSADVETAQVKMLLLHLARALGRIQRGYVAQPLNREMLNSIQSSVDFQKVLQLHLELMSMMPFPIPENEQGHIIANIYSLVLAQPHILDK